MNWISVEDNWPKYGDTILIVVNGVVQNITYSRHGSDDSADWCEPHFFDDKDAIVWWSDVTHWMPLPEPPSNTKYDWSNVLNHVKWIATDADGYAWMYESKPTINLGANKWEGSEEIIHFHPESNFKGDWKESLEQRPGEPQ